MSDIHEGVMTTGKKEQPLFTISPSSGLISIFIILIFLVILPFFFFCITLPVLKTGTLHAIWPVDGSSYGKLSVFFSSIIFYSILPFTLPFFKVGNYVFYENRLEVKSYLLRKNYILEFNELNTLVVKNKTIIISKLEIPEWFDSPIKLYKSVYVKGFCITLNSLYYEDKDMEKLNSAICLLKQKSNIFTLK